MPPATGFCAITVSAAARSFWSVRLPTVSPCWASSAVASATLIFVMSGTVTVSLPFETKTLTVDPVLS
jgi:hypothetical protein